jgi:hypothetical protein
MPGVQNYRRFLPAALAAVVLTVTLMLSACSSTPPSFTAHGTLTVSTGLFSGGSPSALFSDISDGGQVTVVNSSNTVIGNGTLNLQGNQAQTVGESDTYTFTVSSLPGGLSRYGFQIGHNRGTVWETPSEAKHPSLSLSAS